MSCVLSLHFVLLSDVPRPSFQVRRSPQDTVDRSAAGGWVGGGVRSFLFGDYPLSPFSFHLMFFRSININ